MSGKEQYILKLYVVDNMVKSKTLVESLKIIFDNALKDNYRLEIIDILENPEQAVDSKIIATPTLIMEFPKPSKRIVGSISDKESILIGLDLLGNLNLNS